MESSTRTPIERLIIIVSIIGGLGGISWILYLIGYLIIWGRMSILGILFQRLSIPEIRFLSLGIAHLFSSLAAIYVFWLTQKSLFIIFTLVILAFIFVPVIFSYKIRNIRNKDKGYKKVVIRWSYFVIAFVVIMSSFFICLLSTNVFWNNWGIISKIKFVDFPQLSYDSLDNNSKILVNNIISEDKESIIGRSEYLGKLTFLFCLSISSVISIFILTKTFPFLLSKSTGIFFKIFYGGGRIIKWILFSLLVFQFFLLPISEGAFATSYRYDLVKLTLKEKSSQNIDEALFLESGKNEFLFFNIQSNKVFIENKQNVLRIEIIRKVFLFNYITIVKDISNLLGS